MADSLELDNFFSALNTGDERMDIRKCITKIMNTLPFRKLAGKTQVILSLTGPDVRTRLTHTIEVANIAKDICIILGLNEELAEAMAMAHDIGHTPFGHVGERTLREIMCGCDTLGDKVQDCDFDNSGFKHNLQSFRVLIDLERINNDSNDKVEYKNIWPYIIWGALAHTEMTYAKSYSGMDDEIFISSKHCDWVYVCHYDEKKECKRNIQKKKKKEIEKKVKKIEEKEICKPWYCAKLPIIKNRKKIDPNLLKIDETAREYIKKEPIVRTYVDKEIIYCSHKCYMAKLWEHKITPKSTHKEYPYLYDHPFPNSFYAKYLNDYFSNAVNVNSQGFVSFEAQIVNQADEIAQRQQDLEDGINKNLLSFKDAKTQVRTMIGKFKDEDDIRYIYDKIKNITKSADLGKLLVDFYKVAITNQTHWNVTDFVSNANKVQINIYSLMNILYSMDDDNEKKEKWILKEIEALAVYSRPGNQVKIKCLKDYFDIFFEPVYLYLLSYDHLEKCTKQNKYSRNTIKIMFKCIGLLNLPTEELSRFEEKDFFELDNATKVLTSQQLELAYRFIRTLKLLRKYLKNHHKVEYRDFFEMKNEKWKTIGWLKLRSFYSLYQIHTDKFKKKNGPIITISDLKIFKAPAKYNSEKHAKETFEYWKEVLKYDANKVLANLVTFTDKSNTNKEIDTKRMKALEHFQEEQNNTILKSEPVEKNDGKGSFILRRLFKAYITNSHQLPDLALKYILISLIGEMKKPELWNSEKKATKEILDKLKKTMIDNTQTNDELKKIWNTKLLKFKINKREFTIIKKGKSNEIKAALEKRKKLADFFQKLDKKRVEISQKINNDKEKDFIKEQLRNLRAILDNSILNKTLYWESIMTRGICDYIAALTDQEAVNEYEKLYAGVMELV